MENQLERVTASCRTVQAYNERLDTLQNTVSDCEAKVVNNTRLCSIAQTFAENVEDDMKKFKTLYAHKFRKHQIPFVM